MVSIDQKVNGLYGPKRLDAYLVESLAGKYSRQEIQRALEVSSLTVNGKACRSRTLLENGDVVQGNLSLETKSPVLRPEKMDLSVLYEDKNILIIDKPVGMVVHPGAGRKSGTLVNALVARGEPLSSAGPLERPGIVHRLDKDTSGVLIVAKDNLSHRKLQEQFACRTLSKTYLALVKGRVEFDQGRIMEPIGRDPKIKNKMCVLRHELARDAETHYKVLKRFRFATLLEVNILTGRTHQIRVHMAHLGHPVAGDVLYGKSEPGSRLGLHAWKIEFLHPKTGKIVRFESPIPEALQAMIENEQKAKEIEKR